MNDVVAQKITSIQRCIGRAREERQLAGHGFAADYSRQDAAILNITRACEQAIDLANFIIKRKKLGIPPRSRESFVSLAEAGIIPNDLSDSLQRMVGFRNLVVHDYQNINIAIVENVLKQGLDDLLRFTELMVVEL